MRPVTGAVAWVALMLSCLSAAGFAGDEPLDRRLQALTRELRCLVCQNETLADSQAGLAVDLRRVIRERMQQGDSDAAIVAFLTSRYGDFILYRPPLKPATYALWFGPFVLLAGGLAALSRTVNRSQGTTSDVVSKADRRRARALLERAVRR